jgi:hypothetical protein
MEELIDLIAIEIMKILIKDKNESGNNINDYTTYISITSYNLANEMVKAKNTINKK